MRVMWNHLAVDAIPERHELLSYVIKHSFIDVWKRRTLDRQRTELTGVEGRNRHCLSPLIASIVSRRIILGDDINSVYDNLH
ncbi:hypothetical protein [Mycolicibacterium mucogenicum]|uniref:Uncharacterized protein n=1 Tax=Mycolicibacterium mucogenicum DSM 44124 TaxID=1226753 RepID=A0A8H2JC15_MYCMU|nr:hypothetical protein [Mycolicibacterium mucogenicum]KAB7758435.1 hypothetical protein MMUC44124_13910 [Mycolicibacterium mucogenicum DSM 44124]QPG71704.1 hypothetical protein C1S78_012640 [Mycolicibacterium mucogenicum DSM 44124]